MMNPAVRFKTPEAVLRDPNLNDDEKIGILRLWEYDERELAVAINEGMPGPEPVLLSRIAVALSQLMGAR
jgi:hypothetical protein